MRVRFNDLFHVNDDGSISCKTPVVVGGVRLDPGVEFGRRVRLGNVHFAAVAGRDLEIEQEGGLAYLLRPYVPPPPEPVALARMVSAMATEPLPIAAAP